MTESAPEPGAPASIRDPRTRTIFATAGAFLAIGVLLIIFVPAHLLDMWLPNATSAERGGFLAPAAQVVLFSLGGAIAVMGVALSLVRHGEELRSASRDSARATLQRESHELETRKEESRLLEAERARVASVERDLRARFVTAVGLLNAPEPLSRTAGLHTMASLADDWSALHRRDEVQVCVGMICGYLRTPYAASKKPTPRNERAVRQTGYRLIRAHMIGGAQHSWSDLELDLSRVWIDFPVDLTRVVLRGSGRLDFTGASVESVIDLSSAEMSDMASVSLDRARVSDYGSVHIDRATLRGQAGIELEDIELATGGSLMLRRIEVCDQADVTLHRASLSASARVVLDGAIFDGSSCVLGDLVQVAKDASIAMDRVLLRGHAKVRLLDLALDDGSFLTVAGATVGSGTELRLDRAQIGSGAVLSLNGLRVESGASVSVRELEMVGDGQIRTDDVDRVEGGQFLTDVQSRPRGQAQCPRGSSGDCWPDAWSERSGNRDARCARRWALIGYATDSG